MYKEKKFGVREYINTAVNQHKHKKKLDRLSKVTNAETKEDQELYKKIVERSRKHLVGEVTEGAKKSECKRKFRSKKFVIFSPKPEDILTLRGNLKRGESDLNLEGTNPAVAAHEYGHALDYASNGGYKKVAEGEIEAAKIPKPPIIGNLEPRKESGYRDAVSTGVRNMKDEGSASRNALKILKKEGATPEQMSRSRKTLKDALDSYYYGAKTEANFHMIPESGDKARKLRKEVLPELESEYKKSVNNILRTGRNGKERKFDASNRSFLERTERGARYIYRKAQRNPKQAALIGTAAIAGSTGLAYGGKKVYDHYRDKEKEK